MSDPVITVLQRALMGTTLTPEQQEAVFACVSVSYDDCPEDVAAVMEPLMKAETGTRAQRLHDAGIAGLAEGDIGRALDEARERTGCPYLACKQGSAPDTLRLCMMVGIRRHGLGTVMRSFTGDLSEAAATGALMAMTREACVEYLRALASELGAVNSPPVRDLLTACALRVENGTVKG